MNTHESAARLREQFDDRGYVILRSIIEPAVCDAVQREMEAIVDFLADHLMDQGRITDPRKGDPFETRLHHLYRNHLDIAPKNLRFHLNRPGLFGLFFHPALLDLVQALLGPELRLYPNYSARPKLPEWAGTQVLWHQDAGYTSEEQDVAKLRMVNVWMPLVPATVENGCMQFIPGTHKLGVVPHDKHEHYLQIADSVLTPRLGDAVNIVTDPGDVVLFNNLLFHAGLPNRTQTIRWSLDWRYQDATQPTMRPQNGHLARSAAHPEQVVRDARQWASLWMS